MKKLLLITEKDKTREKEKKVLFARHEFVSQQLKRELSVVQNLETEISLLKLVLQKRGEVPPSKPAVVESQVEDPCFDFVFQWRLIIHYHKNSQNFWRKARAFHSLWRTVK